MDKHHTYLWLNFLTVFFPIILSFDKKVAYYKQWKYIFPSLFLTGILYLAWDYIFTKHQVWSFNPNYIVGIYFYGLPLEEILFFITIPFACIFIYLCLLAYIKTDYLANLAPYINNVLLLFSVLMLLMYIDRLYSCINFGTLFLVLLYVHFNPNLMQMGRVYMAYMVTLLPFYIVNGLLTSIPVVMYNNAENMGVRVGSIPLEDHFYSLSLFVINLIFYQHFKNKAEAQVP
ncbi:MAG: lycopene cyclase domain-containing protein [Sphingobacteriales bacterium]|nr:MAG: lycopene cyclase domain-containing protein [Sphingobacteriales bacterium]TAF80003.1 MAG: lycopene cyclase domain-containing protein [Sphingobacteriales bacterium]